MSPFSPWKQNGSFNFTCHSTNELCASFRKSILVNWINGSSVLARIAWWNRSGATIPPLLITTTNKPRNRLLYSLLFVKVTKIIILNNIDLLCCNCSFLQFRNQSRFFQNCRVNYVSERVWSLTELIIVPIYSYVLYVMLLYL